MVDQWLEVNNFNDLYFNIMFNLVILPRMDKPGDMCLVHRCEEKLEKVFDVYEKAAKMGHLVCEKKNVKAWWEKISSRPAWKKLKNLVG
ncbi:hypothetical protein RYX36_028205 [Vicia faba]